MTEKDLVTLMRSTVKETLTSLGLTPCDPQEMQRDMAFLRGARRLFGSVCTKVIIALICSASLVVIGGGIKAFVWGDAHAKDRVADYRQDGASPGRPMGNGAAIRGGTN